MNKTLFIILTIFFLSCKGKQKNNEQKIFDRIEFVYNLKQTIDKDTWGSFNNKEFDVPLIYFTDTSSYIANPTEKFLNSFKSDLVFQNDQIKIYKSEIRVDSLPFHMETSITLGDPTDDYSYHSPFMNCSSYEDVYKAIPDVSSTEEWATMIIHEYFHGFQYKHKSFVKYFENEIAQIPEDSLRSVYKNNAWFKESIDKENQLLLKALDENDSINTKKLIGDFFSLRNKRRDKVSEKLKWDILKYEKCYETMEGTARYVEYSLYKLFAKKEADSKLAKSDSSFRNFEKFRNYEIKKDEWLYLTEKTKYFYAIGFNMARLLDKLKIDYKSLLFKNGAITMEDILYKQLGG